jgi:hypothetical protein
VGFDDRISVGAGRRFTPGGFQNTFINRVLVQLDFAVFDLLEQLDRLQVRDVFE